MSSLGEAMAICDAPIEDSELASINISIQNHKYPEQYLQGQLGFLHEDAGLQVDGSVCHLAWNYETFRRLVAGENVSIKKQKQTY